MKSLVYFAGVVILIIGIFLLIPKSQNQKEANSTQTMPTQTTNSSGTSVATTKAIIETDKGNIEIELYPTETPKTVANFIAKAKSGYYNGLKFHRVEDWVIQGGDPLSKDDSKKDLWGTGGGSIDTELSSHVFGIGSVGVARGSDVKVSNDSQFFICKTDCSFLNNQYTNFGKVTSGMDVVNKIQIGDKIISIGSGS